MLIKDNGMLHLLSLHLSIYNLFDGSFLITKIKESCVVTGFVLWLPAQFLIANIHKFALKNGHAVTRILFL